MYEPKTIFFYIFQVNSWYNEFTENLMLQNSWKRKLA